MPGDPLPPRAARGVYGISVAAELTGIDPQTLRLYERRGLLTPARTDGGTRRYSDADLDRLRLHDEDPIILFHQQVRQESIGQVEIL